MDSPKKRRQLRIWLAVIVFVLALLILAIATLPETRVRQVMPFPPITLPTATPVGLLDTWKGM
jgi:hypothetical protein